jgi:hypothetical protein
MMMKMLEAGGMEVLTDNLRRADTDNPKGYYEFERVKQIEHDKSWLPDAEGKVVKIISQLLRHLPPDYRYEVVFMRRDMEEILASQERMLVRRGEETNKISDEKLAALFQQHLARVQRWLDSQPNVDVIYVSYNQILKRPRQEVKRIDAFLEEGLDVDAMAKVVDPALYRQRA